MTVLDAYAVLAYLRNETAAEPVADLLRSSTVLPAVNAAEVIDQLVRVHQRDPDDIHADLALLSHAGMYLSPVTADAGMLAGRLRARHYHRERRAVSLADCVAAATALSTGRPLATADPALATMIRAEGGSLHALPSSAGRMP
ncbi:MAG TPA: PIN domain-containing protein [Actinomycetales bacterium]|nr:PIN domain-containing protein [Actinomycetales bacterium]